MRIVRYPLEITDYQQVQPLWPGRVLSVGARRYDGKTCVELPRSEYAIDMWCFDNDEHRGPRLPPVLGVWIVGTGNPIDPAMFDADAMFHGTVDMRDAGMGAWHVFSAVVGEAAEPQIEPGVLPKYGSVDEYLEALKARHSGRKT